MLARQGTGRGRTAARTSTALRRLDVAAQPGDERGRVQLCAHLLTAAWLVQPGLERVAGVQRQVLQAQPLDAWAVDRIAARRAPEDRLDERQTASAACATARSNAAARRPSSIAARQRESWSGAGWCSPGPTSNPSSDSTTQ